MPHGSLQPEIGACPRSGSSRALRSTVSCLLLAALVAAVGACSTAPPGTPVVDEEEAKLPPREKSMRVTSAFGGTHRVSKIENGVWFQSFENRVLCLDAQTGTELVDLELAPRGTTGVVSDFLVRGERLFAVLEEDWVMEIDISTVREPKVVSQWGRAELGIRPVFVSAVGDELFVSGEGGAVRLSEATRHGTLSIDSKGRPIAPERPDAFLEGRNVGRVVAAKGGPVACIGRRIIRLADGQYLGAASMLIELPEAAGGGYGFVLQAPEGAQVGLMNEDFRERSASALRGQVHSIRFFDDRFFAVNDFEVATWKMDLVPPAADSPSDASPRQEFVLGALLSVPVKGARDIAKVQRNRFAVAGSFGRALYRYLPEGDKPGDTFYWSRRLPGRLEVAVTDRRRVLASSREGTWLYLIGEEAELSDAPITSPDRPESVVETAWGSARVEETRDTVTFRMGDKSQVHTLAHGALVSGLCAADGKVWIGHDRGIDVIGYDPITQQIVFEDRIRLVGPMIALYPNRVGGGITFVSTQSGFGVVRPVDVEAPPIAARGTRSAFDTSVTKGQS
ncbi:MAG: hypothetical protein RLY21_1159 [Planctomycetota bacterium]|jgi:outer membrane protein assembly factor BamB